MSELLKRIAAGEAFDLVDGVRELARVLTAGPIEVEGSVTAASFSPRTVGKSVGDVVATTEAEPRSENVRPPKLKK